MEKKKIKIPPTAIMILESEETEWRLLIDGLINELKTSAIIELKSNPVRTIRINLSIEDIFPPESCHWEFKSFCNSNTTEEVSNGLCRIQEHLHNTIEKDSWTFVGKINNSAGDVPIIIQYYPVLNLFIYSQKLKSENERIFLPNLN